MTDLTEEQMLEFRKASSAVASRWDSAWRHFANLVAAHERESCAKAMDEFYEQISELPAASVVRECAELIRERGKSL